MTLQLATELVASAAAQTVTRITISHLEPAPGRPPIQLGTAEASEAEATDLKNTLEAAQDLLAAIDELMPTVTFNPTPAIGHQGDIAGVTSLLQDLRMQVSAIAAEQGAHGSTQSVAIILQLNRMLTAIKRLVVYPSWTIQHAPLTLTQAAILTYNTLPGLIEMYRPLNIPMHKLEDGTHYIFASQGVGITREQDEGEDLQLLNLYEMRTSDSAEGAVEYFMPRIVQMMIDEVTKPGDEHASS